MSDARAHQWGWFVSAVGLCMLVGYGLNLTYELGQLSTSKPPWLAFLLGVGFSVPLVYAGWRLGRQRWVDSVAAKRVVGWTLAGVFAVMVTQVVFGLILVAEGRSLAEPQLQLLVGVNGGALAGTLFGYSYERARYDAERAEQAREAVIFMNRTLRHECLNGLNIITGHAERATAHTNDPEVDEALGTIQTRADGMADLIDNIRSFAETFEHGESAESVDLSSCLRGQVAATCDQYPEATIETEIPEALHVAAGDAVERLFSHLLENAVEHNDGEHPQVRVTAESTPDTVRVRVADDGPGIPPEERDAVFDAGFTTREEGHGSGLAIVEQIADAHGWGIDVTDSEAGGARFEFTGIRLPRRLPSEN